LSEDRELVAKVANTGSEMYAKRGGQWPCGIAGRETSNLMLGLAGIGYFYLRLYAPQIPYILMLSRESSEQCPFIMVIESI
jgi:lantibiotic biosynthesis protein